MKRLRLLAAVPVFLSALAVACAGRPSNPGPTAAVAPTPAPVALEPTPKPDILKVTPGAPPPAAR